MTPSSNVPRAIWTRSDSPLYLLTAVTSAVVTWFALDLKEARLNAPFEYYGDALAVGAHMKTTLETGWYEYQPLLGAPYGQTYNDFPTADNLHLVAAKILGLFTDQWPVVLNLYFIIGFPLAALGAVWFLRTVGVSRLLTMALAVVFAIAPYHFMRGEGHLWLASYYAVPLGIGLIVIVLSGGRLWGRGVSKNAAVAWILSPSVRTAVFITLLAMSGSYYAVFFLILLAFAGIAILIRDRDWGRFWGAVAAGVFAVTVMLLNMLPDMIYGWVNGSNTGGLERSAPQTEIFALKLTQLLMPWSGHRIPALQNARALYDAHYPLVSEQPALGALGALGLTIGFLVLAYLAFGWRDLARRSPQVRTVMERVGWLSGLTLVAFLFSTVGGLSTVISFMTDSLRGWNRMSIVILILCLGIVGLVIDVLIRTFVDRFAWPAFVRVAAAVIVPVLIIVIGFIDQTPSDLITNRNAAAKAYDADDNWIAQVRQELSAGSLVLQLPYVPFPESSSVTGVLGSESLVPYLHSRDIRWSGGGIKGRPRSDYPLALQQYDPAQVAVLAATAGFSGILIDRNAMPDHSQELEKGIAATLEREPLVSESKRYSFFTLNALSDRLTHSVSEADAEHITILVTDPVTAYPNPGFSTAGGEDGYPEYTTKLQETSFKIVNPTSDAVVVSVEFVGRSNDASFSDISFPGMESVSVPFSPDGSVATTRTLTVPPGFHELRFTNPSGGELTILHLRLVPHDITVYLDHVLAAR